MIEKPEEIFEGVIAQKAVICQNDTVLVLKGLNSDKWDLPGGRLHKGELPLEGLKREIKEETGCDCEIGKAVCTSQMFHGAINKWAFFIAYEAKLPKGCTVVIPEDEIADYAWLSKDEISPENTWENSAEAVKEYFKNS